MSDTEETDYECSRFMTPKRKVFPLRLTKKDLKEIFPPAKRARGPEPAPMSGINELVLECSALYDAIHKQKDQEIIEGISTYLYLSNSCNSVYMAVIPRALLHNTYFFQ